MELLLIRHVGLVPGLIALALYFLPSIIAVARSHRQVGPIVVINFFLGWTLIGWVLCLAWSVSGRPR